MKKIFLVFAAIALCACSKGPAPEEVEEQESQTVVEIESFTQDGQPAPEQKPCPEFALKLDDCSISTCSEQMDLFGVLVENVLTIKGYNDGKCVYVTSMRAKDPSGQTKEQTTMTCNFNPQEQMMAANYLKTYFESEGNVSVEGAVSLDGKVNSTETIDGKPVDNPFGEFLNSGVCAVPMPPADEPAADVGQAG